MLLGGGIALGLLLGFRLGSIPEEKLPLGELGRVLRGRAPASPPPPPPVATIAAPPVIAEPEPPVVDPCAPDDGSFRCARFLGADDAHIARFALHGVHPLLGASVRVKLRGLEAPSLSAARKCERLRAELTRNFLQDALARSARIDLLKVTREPGGYLVAEIVADGASVSRQLVDKGLARDLASKKGPVGDWCD